MRLLLPLFLLLFIACESNVVNIKDANGIIIETYQILPDSTKNGTYTAFYDTGEVKQKGVYENGVMVGENTFFHKNGNPEIKETYVNGIITGQYYSYYENGQVEISAPYEKGNMNGTLKAYYENGAVKEVVEIVNGDENGPFKEYYENGKIHWEGQYLNGDNEFGLLKEFDENGTLIKKMMCDSLAVCRSVWTLKDGDITPES